MELRQLRYFVAVCEAGSFSHAALALFMTQPPLSTSIANLESELGAQLLRRTRRGVEVTPAGNVLLDSARRVLAELDETTRRLGAIGKGIEGRITISVVPSLNWTFMPRILADFVKASPLVDVTLLDAPPDVAIQDVANGAVDVTIVITADAEKLARINADTLTVHPSSEVSIVAAVPSVWGLPDGALDLGSIRSRTLLLPAKAPRFPGYWEVFNRFSDELDLDPLVRRQVLTMQTALPLIGAGLGWTLMPEWAKSVVPEGVDIRELPAPAPTMRIAACVRTDALPNPALDRLLHVLRNADGL